MIKYLRDRYLKPIIEISIDSVIVKQVQVKETKRNEIFKNIDTFRGMAVAHGLKKLFDQRYFCITDLERCLEAARIIPDGDLVKMLRPLHCMDWADMQKEFREEVYRKIIEMFKNE